MNPLPPPLGREMILGIFPPYFVYTLLIILFIAMIFYWLIRNSHRKESAIDILKKRYAAGEIDKETYERMKEDITEV